MSHLIISIITTVIAGAQDPFTVSPFSIVAILICALHFILLYEKIIQGKCSKFESAVVEID
jgi:hypothetical protein